MTDPKQPVEVSEEVDEAVRLCVDTHGDHMPGSECPFVSLVERMVAERDAIYNHRDKKAILVTQALLDQLISERDSAIQRAEKAEFALGRIAQWELPQGITDRNGRPSTYGAEFGSNGEREFMRTIARVALGQAQERAGG